MEASKPKRKHKKKLKEKSTKTTEKDEVTEDSKGLNDSIRDLLSSVQTDEPACIDNVIFV